jgi:hypothetical protein
MVTVAAYIFFYLNVFAALFTVATFIDLLKDKN